MIHELKRMLKRTNVPTTMPSYSPSTATPTFASPTRAPTPGTPMPTPNEVVGTAWDASSTVLNNQYYNSLLNQPWRRDPSTPGQFLHFPPPGAANPAITLMLNADMSLAFDIGADAGSTMSPDVCGGAGSTCSLASQHALVNTYAGNNGQFQSAFISSFVKMVNVEYSYTDREAISHSGRLGSLTYFNPSQCPA